MRRVLLSFSLLALSLGAVKVIASHSTEEGPSDHRDQILEFFGGLQPIRIDRASSLKNVSLVEPRARIEDVARAEGASHFYVAATEKLLCLTQPRGATCARWGIAKQRGLVLGTFEPPTHGHPRPHDFLLQGIAPNGVRHVMVVIGQSHQITVKVENNAFSVKRDRPVRLKRLLWDRAKESQDP